MTLHLHVLVNFVTDLDELHQQLGQHIAKLTTDTKLLLIPSNFQLWNSKLEATFMSRLNSSV